MNIFTKIRTFYYIKKTNGRYRQFKKCSLPYPYYDKKRDIFEWVYYDKARQGGYDIQNSLFEALSNVSCTGVTYDYEALMYGRKSPEQKEPKYQMMESHCHSFDEVVRCLYTYPESFRIPEEYLYEYSEQELRCLKGMQSYLKATGLKDEKESPEIAALNEQWKEIDNKKKKGLKERLFLLRYSKKFEKLQNKEKFKRYENSRALEFSNYYHMWIKNDTIADAIINGKKDYRIYIQHSFSSSKLNERFLVINSNNDYIGIVEVVSEEIIKFKDLLEDMVDYKLAGFKKFKDYKDHLLKDFKKESTAYNEDFTEDSLIKYVKLKVIEKL